MDALSYSKASGNSGAISELSAKEAWKKYANTYTSDARRTLVTFVDDDIRSVVTSRLFPLYQSKSIPAAVSVITGHIGESTYMTATDLQAAKAAGWEMLGHSHSHDPNLSIYTVDADLDYQLGAGCKGILEGMGFEVHGFAYPQSTHDSRIRRFTRKYYDFSFAHVGINTADYLDPMRINRIAIGAWTDDNPTISGNAEKNTYNYYKACVDYAVANNGWLVFMTHCSDVADGMSEAQWTILGQVIDYIKSISVEIVTPSVAWKAFGNKAFYGDILDGTYTAINEKGMHTPMTQNVKGIKVVTQAAYDALGAGKTSDNTLYLIGG